MWAAAAIPPESMGYKGAIDSALRGKAHAKSPWAIANVEPIERYESPAVGPPKSCDHRDEQGGRRVATRGRSPTRTAACPAKASSAETSSTSPT